jgi:hypothetical protein
MISLDDMTICLFYVIVLLVIFYTLAIVVEFYMMRRIY